MLSIFDLSSVKNLALTSPSTSAIHPLVQSWLRCFHYGYDWVEYIGFVGFYYVSAHYHLIDYEVRLLNVEHYLSVSNPCGHLRLIRIHFQSTCLASPPSCE